MFTPITEPDFRALCAELLDWADRSSAHYYVKPDLLTRARAALAQPAPEGPTDEEVATLIPWLLERAIQAADMGARVTAGRFTLAAQLLGERWGQGNG